MQVQQRRPVVALLVGWDIEPAMLQACALSAASLHADFYYFFPSGVDEERQRIQGMHLNDGQWEKGEFAYPDVVYDRMRRREVSGFTEVYRKLEHVPFTHTLRGRWGRKSIIYNMLRKDETLRRYLIPFQTLRDADAALAFIHEYQSVILKSDRGASGEGMFVVQVKEGWIEVSDQEYVHRLNDAQMRDMLQMLVPQRYCVQQLIPSVTAQGFPFHIRVHVTKNGQGEWIVGFCSPSLSLHPSIKVTNSEHAFRVSPTWEKFLAQHLNEKLGGATDRHIQRYAIQLAQFMDGELQGGFHEIGLDIGLTEQGSIRLFEAGLGLPSALFHFVEMALPAIAYSLHVAARAEQQQTEL
ncbi:YheC/YheD family protein [Paenibacillus wenxiniae]|uniref:YheC/YheD family protein n=1 Tax=Paenibacillus wenxiniae TaxID=1636843 RepID=A0ABW4RNS8_9BACL